MTIWDQQFAGDDFKYGTQPNAFLVQEVGRFKPRGKVLLPGDGEGRNSVWLAAKGFAVTAMDGSLVGLAKARKLAAQNGVKILSLQADLETWVPQRATFDAVAMIYLHLPPDLRIVVLQSLVKALKPKGVLLLEAFHPSQLGLQSGGPKSVDMLYSLELLRSDVQALSNVVPTQEVFAWEGRVLLDEGTGHRGPAQVTRWVLQRR